MDPARLAFAGIARQAELLRDGEVSSRDLTAMYLERIERFDPTLQCLPDPTANTHTFGMIRLYSL